MWYFAWILGVLLAAAFGIINVMWMETEELLGRESEGLSMRAASFSGPEQG